MQLGVTAETLKKHLMQGKEMGRVSWEAPCNLARFLLTTLPAVRFRMTSLRRSSGGEPRPSRALDGQSTSSRCWETGVEGWSMKSW